MSNKGCLSKKGYLEELAEMIASGKIRPDKIIGPNDVVYLWNGRSYVSELGNELFQTVMTNYVRLNNEINKAKLVEFIF